MNHRLRIALIVSAALSTLMALAALAWRSSVDGAASVLDQPVRLLFLVLLPCFMTAAILVAERQLASRMPRLADDHRRYLEVSLAVTFLLLTLAQVWSAVSYVQGGATERETFLRFVAVWVGVSLAVRGNFMAKAGPPTGSGAPDWASWTRSMMGSGRLLVGWGMTLVLLAIILPPKALFVAFVATSPILVLVTLAHRRAVSHSARG